LVGDVLRSPALDSCPTRRSSDLHTRVASMLSCSSRASAWVVASRNPGSRASEEPHNASSARARADEALWASSLARLPGFLEATTDRESTGQNLSHRRNSYAVLCL